MRDIYSSGIEAVEAVADLAGLEETRVRFLGRKAALTTLLRSIPELPAADRPNVGRFGNLVKRELEAALEARQAVLEAGELVDALEHDRLDVTLPGRTLPLGHLHLITSTRREIEDIFVSMGYSVAEGPEIETDYYNFEALNHPADHPARSLHDTFFVSDDILLRTHTSPVQVRVMEKKRPPVYVIAPGKAYRRDSDATHTPMFHQVEGLVVDEGVTLADLKGTLEVFARAMFGSDRQIRLRPHFFPFTEPSVEVDVSCMICDGVGCRLCKRSGWLEILGAGMVDPNVFAFVGYDSEKYTGFAFGMGIERIAMLKHGVTDLRLFYENDLRFVRQF
ncbi:MAG: phenylalanine--tRNA ligase subunit alpha [Actinobacteria bacterium]|nr:phenylalanine--tRNA ligase subunit alpha [Actinomycetota bacterium]